jgi:hypothetical protein
MTGFSPTRVIGGRYVLLGDIGSAREGAVWRASDRVTGRQVAVEELHLLPDPDERRLVRDRLLRAARATGRLDHPGLVTIHDVVTDGDVDHIVTELVDAPTLAHRVATDGPLDETVASATARQVAAALHAAHTAGIVHGDVSPHTVLLGPDGKVCLAGVGVAEAVDPLRTTRDPAFLAPELRDGGPATPESDMWAFGAALHVALLGRPPADGVAPEFGGGALGSALVGMLKPAPRERPTARQVVTALDAARRLAHTTPGRGRRWWWAAAGVVLGLLVGLAAGFALAGPRIQALTYGPGGDVRLGGTAACLDAAPAPGVVIGAADCAGPHGAEIVATLDPFGDRDVRFPGRDALVRFAAGACAPAHDAVVEPPRRAGAELVALVPTEAAFGAGDRDVHCVVRAGDGAPVAGKVG